MRIETKVKGLEPVKHLMDRLSRGKLQAASAKAINDTGFEVRRALQGEMGSKPDRPTDYIMRSPRLIKATRDKPVAIIEPAYPGGKGVEPEKILEGPGPGRAPPRQAQRGGAAPGGNPAHWLPDRHSSHAISRQR